MSSMLLPTARRGVARRSLQELVSAHTLVKVQLNGNWQPDEVAAAAQELQGDTGVAILQIKGKTIMFAAAGKQGSELVAFSNELVKKTALWRAKQVSPPGGGWVGGWGGGAGGAAPCNVAMCRRPASCLPHRSRSPGLWQQQQAAALSSGRRASMTRAPDPPLPRRAGSPEAATARGHRNLGGQARQQHQQKQ